MRTGDLRHKITFEQPVRVADEMGGFDLTWQTYCECWAAIWPVKADERNEGDKQSGMITHRVRVRFRRGLRADMRIRFGSKFFSVCSEPSDMGMSHEFIEILCREVSR